MTMREEARQWVAKLDSSKLGIALDAIKSQLELMTLDGVEERAIPEQIVWHRMTLHTRRIAIWERMAAERTEQDLTEL